MPHDDTRAMRDAAQLRHQLYDSRLQVGYTLDLAALTAFTPFAEQLESVLEQYPAVAELLRLDPTQDLDDQLHSTPRTGWLVGASRAMGRQLGPISWFYAPTYEGVMQAALQWARSGEFEEAGV